MLVELVVTAGPHAGRSFSFTEHSTFFVGRSSQAHFSLPGDDPHISRLHFLVEVNPPFCRLRNMSSTNGTLVNSTRATEADLRNGDRIMIGRTELAVQIQPIDSADGATIEGTPTETLSVGLPHVDPMTHSAPWPASSADLGSFGQALMGLASSTTPTSPQVPLTIPGYRIGRILGAGGMGIVYEAMHLETGQSVAVKTLLPRGQVSQTALARFIRETEILKRLDHPGVVRFRDSGVTDATVWFAMELVPGRDADAVAAAAGTLDIGRAVNWVIQALEALAFAHDQGYVHRDVKPQNLLVAEMPNGAEVIKVSDFGLARAYEASPLSGLTLTGTTGGSPPFMPPEQVRDLRSVKPAADQYSAAATLYRLIAGRHIYPAKSRIEDLFALILQTDPEPLTVHRPDVSAPLASAIHRALARDASARFPDCRKFAAALRPFAN